MQCTTSLGSSTKYHSLILAYRLTFTKPVQLTGDDGDDRLLLREDRLTLHSSAGAQGLRVASVQLSTCRALFCTAWNARVASSS